MGMEITETLLEQGGYVIIVDTYNEKKLEMLSQFNDDELVSFLDYTILPHLDEEVRRLDYVFYFTNEDGEEVRKITSHDFLNFSNYFDATLALAAKFEAKFLLGTSIKAHQQILAKEEVLLNFGSKSEDKHMFYTNLECQRYAESLTMEYFDRVNLDIRIVRLAEFAGEGMDFTHSSAFKDLVISAAKGENLKLKKDGLESEYLVHILDAAYGVIKAQFSQNTTGKIFSIAYDNSYSHLSIAYTLQEVEESVREIVFINESDNLPPLKLYKPAPNLSTIGWTSRVLFDKSIQQSVAAAKIFLLKNIYFAKGVTPTQREASAKEKKGFMDKLKSFIDIADKKDINVMAPAPSEGPIGDLIEERKRQEEMRKQSMTYANLKIKEKKRYRPRTPAERFRLQVWNFLLDLGRTFSIFRNRTPTEAGFIILMIIFGILFYFSVFSPLIVVSREIMTAYPEYENIISSIKDKKYNNLEQSATRVYQSVDNIQKVLKGFEGTYNLLGQKDLFDEYISTLESLKLYSDGLKNLGYATVPFYEYLSIYKNNTQLRFGTDSYLSIEQKGEDYETQLLEMGARVPNLRIAQDKLLKANSEISSLNVDNYPQFLHPFLNNLKTESISYSTQIQYVESIEYIPDLLGTYANRTYLITVLDNTRIHPVGGDLAAYALITVEKGAISEIIVQSPLDKQGGVSLSELTQADINLINKRRYETKNISNLTVGDIGSIENFNDYTSVISRVLGSNYNRKISGVVAVDYSYLETLIKGLSSTVTLKVEDKDVTTGDLLATIKSNQDSAGTLSSKYRYTAILLANLLDQYLEKPSDIIGKFVDVSSSEIINQSMKISTPQLNYSDFLNKENFDGSYFSENYDFLLPGLIVNDPKVINSDKFISIDSSLNIDVLSDLTRSFNYNVKFPNVGTTQEFSLCIPLTISNSNISIARFNGREALPTDRYTINTGDLEKCIVVKVIAESDLTFIWKAQTSLSTSSTVKILQSKVDGTINRGDFTIKLGTNLELGTVDPSIELVGNQLRFTEVIKRDRIVSLTLTK